MKLITDWCCAANVSMFLLPFWSVSPNAYCAPLVENKMRASTNVIHPRSSGDNADKERASVASVVPSSLMPFGGATSSNSFWIRLIEVSCGLHACMGTAFVQVAGYHDLLLIHLPPMGQYIAWLANAIGGAAWRTSARRSLFGRWAKALTRRPTAARRPIVR